MKKYFFILAILLLNILGTYSQSIAINNDGSKPNPNAIVDVKSTTKGVLLPRMTTAERHAIPNTKGLLVYDTDENLYCYNDGFFWQSFFTANLFKNNGPSWSVTGNSHTQDKSNFIGTRDNVPLNIRVNNQPSGRIDSAGANAFWGYRAGGVDSIGVHNVAVGDLAFFSNVTTDGSVAIGYRALYTFTGISSIGGNVAVGDKALQSDITGDANEACGANALQANTTGFFNTGNGYGALQFNGTGSNNTGTGFGSLDLTTTGSRNTATGANAVTNNVTGSNNTGDGFNALITDETGSNLTALGANADVSIDGLDNATAIGNGTIVDASNKVRIGNTNVTVIEGQVPFTTPSDGRFKFNVQENVRGLDFILKLRPVTYQFDVKKQEGFTRGTIKPGELNNYVTSAGNDEATQMIRTGFIAQEVEQAAKKTGYDFDGVKAPKTEREYYSLSYSSFVVPLVKAVQEQEEIIQEQKKRITELEQLINHMDDKKIEEQNIRINSLEQELAEINKSLKVRH